MDVDLLDLDPYPIDSSDDKYTITVICEGKETLVSWYKGLDSKDIEEAIICACDSIIDQGFTLTDSNGQITPIGHIMPGATYFIIPGAELPGMSKVLGDRFRRLSIEIPPLQHVECTKALELLKSGSNLLKHTRNSLPHIRLFQITDDLRYLIWYSSGKSHEKASILLENISEVKLGQLTENFINYPIPALEHLSFSLIHSKGTLDLTCRDEREFDFWVLGFKAIISNYKGLNISKQTLLSHSKRFSEFLRQNKFTLATSEIYKEPESKKLEECIVRRSLSREDISVKLVKVHNKLTILTEKILDLPNDVNSYDMGKESIEAYGGDYAEIFLEDTGREEIYHTEQQRMGELSLSCRNKLFELETEFSNKFEVPAHHDTAQFEIELWRLEVDVENLNDIVNRIQKTTEEKWGTKVKSWFKDLF